MNIIIIPLLHTLAPYLHYTPHTFAAWAAHFRRLTGV